MNYDPDILIKHPSLHHDIFRLKYKEMQKAIDETSDEDGASWERSDYEDVRRLLDHLNERKRDTFHSFAEKMKELNGLEKLPLRKRFRFIYFLLSSYVDWRKTTVQPVKIAGIPGMYLSEAIQKDPPKIEIDFQSMLDVLLSFQPDPSQQSVWGDVFSQGPSEHQSHTEESAENEGAD
jgi:hypothetical protein